MKEIQHFLNYYTNAGLVVDGIIGNKSKVAIEKAVNKLKEHCNKHNLVWDNEYMFIGVRTDEDLDNSFDDWFIFIEDNIIKFACPASTVSGTPGISKYWNRIIRGRAGVGTIVENQQINYLVVKPVKGNTWSMWTGGLGFLFQDKPISVYRGAVKRNNVWYYNKENVVHNDLGGGFNVHSWSNWFSPLVNNLSEGCQVTKANYWRILFNYLDNYSRVTYTLILNK